MEEGGLSLISEKVKRKTKGGFSIEKCSYSRKNTVISRYGVFLYYGCTDYSAASVESFWPLTGTLTPSSANWAFMSSMMA